MIKNQHSLNLILLIINRLSGSVLFLSILSVWFFILGTVQGYGETNLTLLLNITQTLGILGLTAYLLELFLSLFLLMIQKVKRFQHFMAVIKSVIGILVCTALSLSTTIYYQFLSF
jgi:hypothetical protein